MRIEALELPASDLPALAAFYGGKLGLRVIEERADRLELQAGRTRLTFAPAPPGWQGAYHFAFNIPGSQLAEAKAWLAARVAPVRGSGGEDEFDFVNWDAHAVYAYDPAGNIIELIARHALKHPGIWPFDGRGLLEVSELGLATPAVPDTVAQFERELGLSVFRDSASETFAAMGGETGLFIIVREGRAWFPDLRVTAAPLPVSVTVATAPGERFMVSGPPYRVMRLARAGD
jgi:catechol-2,3-dioxygenase